MYNIMTNLNVTDQMPNSCTLLNPHISKPTSITNCMMTSPQPSSASSAPPSNSCASVTVDPKPRIQGILPVHPLLPVMPLNLNSFFPNLVTWINNNPSSSNEYPRSATFSGRGLEPDANVSSDEGFSDYGYYSRTGDHDHLSARVSISPGESENIIEEADILVDSMIKPGVNNRKGWMLNFLQWRAGKDVDEPRGLANVSNGISLDEGPGLNKDSVTPLATFTSINSNMAGTSDESSKGIGDDNMSDDEDLVGMQTMLASDLADHIDPNYETVCGVEYDEMVHDRQSIAPFLHEVPLSEAKEISKMCMLSNLAYIIPQIQHQQLLQEQGLTFITSSIARESADTDRQNMRSSSKKNAASQKKAVDQSPGIGQEPLKAEGGNKTVRQPTFGTTEEAECPCEWFICDDKTRKIRYVVIQGSESLASWQTNLAFEPTRFEGLHNVWVHRGIYEAANGLYKEVLGKLQMQQGWKLCFTGHSLGGSLGMLVVFMAIKRGSIHENIVENVVSFGAPYVLCGGEHIIQELRMCTTQFLNVVFYRDIVPRAFSCDYPQHVAHILKHVNGMFRHHPCLNFQRFLYAPLGEMLILQPSATNEEHELLPTAKDARLYKIRHPTRIEKGVCNMAEQMEVMGVQRAFLNAPHPLEMMVKDIRAITRDHDPRTYARAMKMVVGCHQLVTIEPTQRIGNQNFNSQSHQTFPILIGNKFHHNLLILNNLAQKPIFQRYCHLVASQRAQIGMLFILSMTLHLLSSLFAWA